MKPVNKETCRQYVQEKKERLKKIVKEKNLESSNVFIIQVGDNPASNVYIKGKRKDCAEMGIRSTLFNLDERATTTDIKDLIYNINLNKRHNKCAGIFVQLPLPARIDETAITNFIPDEFDVDGFKGTSMFTPCTPKGIIDYLDYCEFNFEGKVAVVLGRSEIVGKPILSLLRDRNCTVIQCHSRTKKEDMIAFCQRADLIISAVGKNDFVTKEYINDEKKQILIDVGINRKEDGALCGDADPKIYDCPNLEYTPVPGGVGLFTRLALVDNIISARAAE